MTELGGRSDAAMASGPGALPTASVVICAYTEQRWDQIVAAVASVRAQSHKPEEIVLVVDHNEVLLERARQALPEVVVVPNTGPRGLSGGRNSGVRTATGEVLVFLDDDATAYPGWLAALLGPYRDPDVVGTGGFADAAWPTRRPQWFPPEFDWVVGCSYVGLPDTVAPVRNPIGSTMSFRRRAFDVAGGFDDGIGRLGTLPLGCEETVFSIRLHQQLPGARVLHVPHARVAHTVSPDRTSVAYFLRRCVAEGLSKALVTAAVGQVDGLRSERRYTTSVLPPGIVRGLRPGRGRGNHSPSRSAMIVAGLTATTFGYLLGRLHLGGVAQRLIGGTST